jgi:hypothetical protein
MLETIVVGVGLYGLSATAHLRKAGVETKTFGSPMGFRRDHTPTGNDVASCLERVGCSQPNQEMTLAAGDEILSTLDQNTKQHGLRFCWRCTILWATVPCFERVEKISAQNTRCVRRITNPLLFEGGNLSWGGISCDRACLHF